MYKCLMQNSAIRNIVVVAIYYCACFYSRCVLCVGWVFFSFIFSTSLFLAWVVLYSSFIQANGSPMENKIMVFLESFRRKLLRRQRRRYIFSYSLFSLCTATQIQRIMQLFLILPLVLVLQLLFFVVILYFSFQVCVFFIQFSFAFAFVLSIFFLAAVKSNMTEKKNQVRNYVNYICYEVTMATS